MHRFWDFFKSVGTYSMTITTLIFSFVPESCFSIGYIPVNIETDTAILYNRLLTLLVVFIVVSFVKCIFIIFRKRITIKHKGYTIVVEYANIFDKIDCKKVIGFDECFTPRIGNAPADIKPSSICGQFLSRHPNINITNLLSQVSLKKQKKRSEYNNQYCYESGRILPYNDYLLLAFTKLDSAGLGRLTREEYVSCLDILWEEIDKYYACQSVAIPILGSGITRFRDENLTQQQLLDIIIASYKMSPYKIKRPAELHIVCRKSDGFSLNRIGEYV